MKNFLNIIALVLLVFTYSCNNNYEPQKMDNSATEKSQSSPEETKAVFDHHMGSFTKGDLAAIVSDYTDASVVITPDGTFSGLDEIEELFAGLLPAFPPDETVMEVDKVEIQSGLAYVIWHGSGPSIEVQFATDTFVIEDGKILWQTFAAVMNPIEEAVKEGAI